MAEVIATDTTNGSQQLAPVHIDLEQSQQEFGRDEMCQRPIYDTARHSPAVAEQFPEFTR